jgi:FixJ family two-component response regulator
MTSRINVIDPDVRRRANVASRLMGGGFHVEIYEDLAEFSESSRVAGLVFTSDECETPVCEMIAAFRRKSAVLLPIVAYGESPAPEHVVDAVRAGLTDYLQWPFTRLQMDRLFRRLANGGDQFLQKEALRNDARNKVQDLTGRETNVLSLLVQGLPNKGIARELGISPRTVEIHRANMMEKLGAQTAPDAIRIGIYAGLDERLETPLLVAAA